MATPLDKLEFYYRNYIDCEMDGYTLSGDFSNAENVGDRYTDTCAVTVGKDTDIWPPPLGPNASFIIEFSNARNIDTIFLRSNLASFQVYINNPEGEGDPIDYLVYAEYANAAEFVKIDLSALLGSPARTIKKISIGGLGTITPNEEKRIYELIVTKKITEMQLPEGAEIVSKAKGTTVENIEGGNVMIFDFPNSQKMEINLSLNNWEGTNYTAYALLKQRRLIDSYLVYAYLSDTISHIGDDALYLMTDISDDTNTPSDVHFSAGIDGELQLREA